MSRMFNKFLKELTNPPQEQEQDLVCNLDTRRMRTQNSTPPLSKLKWGDIFPPTLNPRSILVLLTVLFVLIEDPVMLSYRLKLAKYPCFCTAVGNILLVNCSDLEKCEYSNIHLKNNLVAILKKQQSEIKMLKIYKNIRKNQEKQNIDCFRLEIQLQDLKVDPLKI